LLAESGCKSRAFERLCQELQTKILIFVYVQYLKMMSLLALMEEPVGIIIAKKTSFSWRKSK